MPAPDADVIVVGGGPAGSTTAALLAQRGHDVLLLERAAFPRDKPCGEYLNPGVVETLRRLGALEDVDRASPAVLAGMTIVSRQERHHLDYSPSPNGVPAIGIRRSVLDHVLLERARRCGVRIAQRSVTAAVEEGGRVVGVSVRTDAGVQTVRARLTVAADGGSSVIARSLGLVAPLRWPRRLGLVAHYSGANLRDSGQMHVGDSSYCGLAPVDGAVTTVGLVVPLRDKPSGEPVADFFERQLLRLPGVSSVLHEGKRVGRIRGVAPLAHRVRRVAGRGYLLVGDAAGFFDPFTGEGIFRALRGAELAAKCADAALRRGDDLPARYAEARHSVFRDKERLCLLVAAFQSSPRALEYCLRRLNRRPSSGRLLADVLGDYHPAGAALTPAYLTALLRP